MASDPLIPINTPFSYNVGINYETWENGRTGYSIAADLNQITQYFGLIKTFHDGAVGTPQRSVRLFNEGCALFARATLEPRADCGTAG